MRPKVYKKYGYWWVLWPNPNGFLSNTCFDTNYHEAQWFANVRGGLP